MIPKPKSNYKKKQRKQKRKNKRRIALEQTKKLIDSRRFILEANQLSGKTGFMFDVNPSLNFVSIDSSHCVIQLGSNSGLGYNGVGGITTEGKISKMTVLENKKGDSFTINLYTSTPIGSFDIVFFIDAEGTAQADVSQSTTGGSATYYGNIIPLDQARVFKGRSL
ncbi:MAG: DUF4251 domain-containing protein [Bacteroidales bacterium]|nr:DUF4251 domain-containing protein [Bacteroidales bacterium]